MHYNEGESSRHWIGQGRQRRPKNREQDDSIMRNPGRAAEAVAIRGAFTAWGGSVMDIDKWRKRVEEERRGKDVFFASHPQSPLPLADRGVFQGLAYWPPDPDYRFELPLREHHEKEVMKVADTGGQERRLWRWGEFRFRIAGREATLLAYKSDIAEERLFAPFRDETSGKESYGAGRYLDLEPDRHLTEEGNWTLDFNEAYNPWCAYSKDYVCPFVPPENWLKVPIRAGEKKYPLK
jgi:uncharacterized protein (DUF1684 family)